MRRLLAFLLLPAMGLAAESCPWMNAATAGGFLGAAVNVSVTHESNNRDDAACTFQGGQGSVTQELRIDVQTMDTPRSEYTSHAAQCSPGAVALKAIGNEAVLCGPDEGANARRTAQVVGRVRTRIFTVLVTTTDPSLTSATLRERARSVAEQVAGFLF